MDIKYPAMGICGLSCLLCPRYHTDGSSRCGGCKSEFRMGAGCPFITCAVKKKGIEFCWECGEYSDCEKWRKHREAGKSGDSFKCYQKLSTDIDFIRENGFDTYWTLQREREDILKEMLSGFNEGRSKSYYCIAATVMEIEELQGALAHAKRESGGMDIKAKSKALHGVLDGIAAQKGYVLKLRK